MSFQNAVDLIQTGTLLFVLAWLITLDWRSRQ